MSLKKAYDALRIEASNEIMHAAITMELPSGNCVRELRCYSRPSQKNSSQIVTVNSVHEEESSADPEKKMLSGKLTVSLSS